MRAAPLAAVALLLLAGCAYRAAFPQDQGTPWTEWPGPWVEMSSGCGMCGGGLAQGPEMELLALDRDGRVLRVGYAVGGARPVTFVDPALERWRAVVEPLFAGRDHYGQEWEKGHVRVFEVQALQLAPDDRDQVAAAVERAARDLPEVGEPTFDCVDCGGTILKAEGRRAHLGSPVPANGWAALQEQMQALHAWLDGRALE